MVAEEVGTSNIVVASLNGSRLMNLELIWSSALPMLERRELDRENAGEAMIELFLKEAIDGGFFKRIQMKLECTYIGNI